MLVGPFGVEAFEEGAGENGFDAASASAIALRPLWVEYVVAPLAGDALAPVERALPDDNADADDESGAFWMSSTPCPSFRAMSAGTTA